MHPIEGAAHPTDKCPLSIQAPVRDRDHDPRYIEALALQKVQRSSF